MYLQEHLLGGSFFSVKLKSQSLSLQFYYTAKSLSHGFCNQAYNQKFFRAREVSWNLGTSTNISSKTQDRSVGKNFGIFFSQILLKLHFEQKNLTQRWIKSGPFFQNQGTFFYFQKRAREASSPASPASCTPGYQLFLKFRKISCKISFKYLNTDVNTDADAEMPMPRFPRFPNDQHIEKIRLSQEFILTSSCIELSFFL